MQISHLTYISKNILLVFYMVLQKNFEGGKFGIWELTRVLPNLNYPNYYICLLHPVMDILIHLIFPYQKLEICQTLPCQSSLIWYYIMCESECVCVCVRVYMGDYIFNEQF